MSSQASNERPSIPLTESVNPASVEIDRLSTSEIVDLMNSEDAKVAEAVSLESKAIGEAIDVITERIRGGGRLIYIGAGTSGRLGVLDASECPPTFNTPPEMVVGLIAGGDSALRTSAEGIEDIPEQAVTDLNGISLSQQDVVVGIATSGRTPYVIGGLQFARTIGAFSIGLACTEDSRIAAHADLMIAPVVGPELLTGSTRLKAGTATKMVVNMLTTGTMIKLGKTYGNLMVDLRATNLKLIARSRRIAASLTGLTEEDAEAELARCDGELKTTIVAIRREVDPSTARSMLSSVDGHLRDALEQETPTDE